jgi:N4-gp56 family major capsid protein
MKNFILNLQLFAEAGSVVNTLTNGYVNANTGASVSADDKSLSAEVKIFYDTELLENARPNLVYAQFAKKQPLPKKHGGTVEWRKFDTFKPATKLLEGVIPEAQKGGTTTKTGFISQYGTYVAVADVLEMRAYDSNSLGYYNA